MESHFNDSFVKPEGHTCLFIEIRAFDKGYNFIYLSIKLNDSVIQNFLPFYFDNINQIS